MSSPPRKRGRGRDPLRSNGEERWSSNREDVRWGERGLTHLTLPSLARWAPPSPPAKTQAERCVLRTRAPMNPLREVRKGAFRTLRSGSMVERSLDADEMIGPVAGT